MAENQKIINDTDGNEVVMIRTDKTLKEMMDEPPAGRWDADYWDLQYDAIMNTVSKGLEVVSLYDLLSEPIIAPDHVRASKGERILTSGDCEYRTLKDLKFTGLDYSKANYCSDNAFLRLRRTQLRIDDILFAGSGVGAIGRIGIVERLLSDKSCVGDLFIIRNPNLDPYYLYLYLLTKFGQSQIKKVFHGVQSSKISKDEIGLIKIVLVKEKVVSDIKIHYKAISQNHYKAMRSNKVGETKNYEINLEKAEKLLIELLTKIEQIIQGEREDVT